MVEKMSYKLTVPSNLTEETALHYRVHLGHRENAVNLAMNLIRKAAQVEIDQLADDPLLKELCSVGEPWAIYTLLQGAYVREYHEWEKAIKNYINTQYRLNHLREANWHDGPRRSLIQRTTEHFAFFSAELDQGVMSTIDDVRDTVNKIKHDPTEHEVDKADYDAAIRAFGAFWNEVMELEGFVGVGVGTIPFPLLPSDDATNQFNDVMQGADPARVISDLRKLKGE